MSSATGLARLRRNVGTARVSVRKRWAPVAAEAEEVSEAVAVAAPAHAAAAAPAHAPPEIAPELRTAVDALGAKPGEVVADALRLFLTRYAAAEKLPLGRVLYCFVLRLVMQLDEWRAEAEQIALTGRRTDPAVTADLTHPSLGVLAAELGAYPILAHHLMEGSPDAEPDGRPDAERVAALGKWLDQAMPSPGSPISREFGCSTYAARCALPFALGYRNVLQENQLRSVSRLLVAGDVKQVGYALNFLKGGAGRGRGMKARRGEAEGGMKGLRSASPASRSSSYSSSSSDSEPEDDDPSEDSDVEGGTGTEPARPPPPFRSLLKAHRPSLPSTMQPSLTAAEFHTILRWLGEETDSLSVMQLLGYELPPYAKRRSKSGAEMIEAGKPYLPRATGSVLRAYLREIHGQRVDDCEPGVQTMADVVPA